MNMFGPSPAVLGCAPAVPAVARSAGATPRAARSTSPGRKSGVTSGVVFSALADGSEAAESNGRGPASAVALRASEQNVVTTARAAARLIRDGIPSPLEECAVYMDGKSCAYLFKAKPD